MRGEIHSPADIGAAVRRNREKHGLGQRELAGRLGISQTYLSQLERGTPKILDADYLEILRRCGVRLGFEVADD